MRQFMITNLEPEGSERTIVVKSLGEAHVVEPGRSLTLTVAGARIGDRVKDEETADPSPFDHNGDGRPGGSLPKAKRAPRKPKA